MPTCPVCEKALPETLPPFCDQCGWDLKSDLRLTPFVGDIPESTIEEYKRRLNIAQKSWRKRIHLEAQQKVLIKKIKEIQAREQDTSARLETLQGESEKRAKLEARLKSIIKEIQAREQDTSARLETLQAESEKRAKLEARLKSLESELASARRQASRPAPTPATRPSRGRWLFLMVVALLIGVTVYLVNQYREPAPIPTPPTDAVENESTDATTETAEEKDESGIPADVSAGAVGSESIETSDETIEESEKSGMSIYSQKTAVPSLKRDPFETIPEFKKRIETHPPIPAGQARLIKDQYDIETGTFPIRMEWRDWITKFARVSNTGDWHVNAERDMARTIFESGPTHPVYVRLKSDGEDVLVSVVEMVAGEWVFKVEDLRKTPITVSDAEFKKVFGLNDNRKPLEYIQNDYHDNGDGTVTDRATGLTWEKSGSSGYMNYEKAREYVRGLNAKRFANHADWRLPTVDELASLLEPEEQSGDLYIHPIFDDNQRYCWTADQQASGGAWSVDFLGGNVDPNRPDNDNYVRAVRP